jgi:hypothetical protein
MSIHYPDEITTDMADPLDALAPLLPELPGMVFTPERPDLMLGGNTAPRALLDYGAPAGPEILPGVPAIITRAEAACICHVSQQTIDRMIARGAFTPDDDGNILRAELERYLLTHTLADQPVEVPAACCGAGRGKNR